MKKRMGKFYQGAVSGQQGIHCWASQQWHPAGRAYTAGQASSGTRRSETGVDPFPAGAGTVPFRPLKGLDVCWDQIFNRTYSAIIFVNGGYRTLIPPNQPSIA